MPIKNGKPNSGSGKTHFNKIKSKGESWTGLRDKAIKNGSWKREGGKENA